MGLVLLAHFGSGVRGFSLILRHREEDPYRSWPELAWVMGALAAAAAYLAHSAVDFNLHLPGNALWMAFIFGILANPGVPKKMEINPDAAPQRAAAMPTWFARLTGCALGAGLLALIVPKFVPEYWTEKSRVALRNGRYDDAIAFADRAAARDSANPVVLYQKGEAYRLKGDASFLEKEKSWNGAVGAYRAALGIFERDVFTWLRLGRALESLFNYPEAGKAFRRAVELDPNERSTWGYYVAFLLRVGREGEAEDLLAKRGQSIPWFDLNTYKERPRERKPRQ
jgi:tetratricopeptide (TPR) repeat protein